MIPVIKEPKGLKGKFYGEIEKCIFCGKPSLWWYIKSNTPVCKACAAIKNVKEIPK